MGTQTIKLDTKFGMTKMSRKTDLESFRRLMEQWKTHPRVMEVQDQGNTVTIYWNNGDTKVGEFLPEENEGQESGGVEPEEKISGFLDMLGGDLSGAFPL